MWRSSSSCFGHDAEMDTCMNCTKKRNSLFDELSYDELAILNKRKHVVHYKAGETIYKEGTKPPNLLCLNRGKVKITQRGVNGTEHIVALKKPVDFIGFRALMGDYNNVTSAVALEEAVICIIDKRDFFQVIHNNSQLAFKIIRSFAHELNAVDLRLVNLTQKHIRARLADALLWVQEIYGVDPDNGALNVALKRADIAALANMTTANAIRILASFAKEGLVEVNLRSIILKKPKALQEISLFGR
ncbi:MAG: Crp/Fnr family transcriptional regulator [Lewinella sp.]|nr:Crp/Fnr family transcriptional regulator [Lewinella sp.]